MDTKTTKISKFVYVGFLLILLSAFILPSTWVFNLQIGFTALCLLAGFARRPEFFRAVIMVWGTIAIITVFIEGSHYGAAKAYDLPVEAVTVTMLYWVPSSPENNAIGVGAVVIGISENEVDADQTLQNQISWVSVAGSIGVLLFTIAYFVYKTASNVPALFGAIAFIWHQAPFLTNDQSMCISHGWMSPEFAWAWFIFGLFVMFVAFVFAVRRGEGMITPQEAVYRRR